MEQSEKADVGGLARKIILRALVFVLVILAGVGMRKLMLVLRKPPQQVEVSEVPLQVEVTCVQPEDVPVVVTIPTPSVPPALPRGLPPLESACAGAVALSF